MNNKALEKVWVWFGSYQSYRIVSATLLVCGAIATSGRTENLVAVLLYCIEFGAIWYLGYGSAQRGESA